MKERQYIVWSRLDRTELGVGWTVGRTYAVSAKNKAPEAGHSALREEKRKRWESGQLAVFEVCGGERS